MLNKWVFVFLHVEMMCFNFEDALLLPFSLMQLWSSLRGRTGIEFTLIWRLKLIWLLLQCYYLLIPIRRPVTSQSLYPTIHCYPLFSLLTIMKSLTVAELNGRALASGQVVQIHPSSVLFQSKAECVIFNELVQTTKKYIRNVTRIDYLWLTELAPHYYASQS